MAQAPVLTEELALLMQRVADGQATDADLEAWSAALERDPELAEVLDAFTGMSSAVGATLRAQAAGVPALDLERRIMRGLDEPAPGAWARFKDALAPFRWVLAPLVAGGLAAALAVTLPGLLGPGPAPVTPGTPDTAAVASADVDELDVEGTAVVFQASPRVTVIWVTTPAQDGLDAPPEVTSHLRAPQDAQP